ncbi:hypothetical protein [Asanoa iriomotensis]|uniref:Excreted virulence factor EspC (Type VII ESX diderm) n=1 Tax=Asanoa iriomotensis TaxID=234613 RepID=A0ABQ4CDM6_9ACTN|nr:hypothetical protein [Asanoa iriomotensis]GIF60855.1 hypothetical protein Air01nite_69500 [Asanoa iriomotensis]
MTLSSAARRLDEAAADLGDPAFVDVGPAAFGADLPGRLGVLGRELHERWSSSLFEGSRSATALAARLTDAAAALRTAGGGYATVEDDAARRTTEAGGT